MSEGRTLRIGLITGAIVLAAGIYLLPKKPLQTKKEEVKVEQNISSDFSIDQFITDAKGKLPWEQRNRITAFEEVLKAEPDSFAIYDSIGLVWDMETIPGVSATYFEQKAERNNSEGDWLKAAYRYFDAYKAADDSASATWFTQQAINCYQKVIELNPANLDAKTDLGVLYAEGTAEPMKGIMMLREVVTENPLHQNAHLNLGFLSMKSGQFDKAIERFQKVQEINPARIDMYVYIGEAYVRTGNKKLAIENFEKFKSLSNDRQMISNVDKYIEALNKK